MQSSHRFQSIFKINGVPILPPVIDDKLREEINLIRHSIRAKELKLLEKKEQKDHENLAKQSANDVEEMLRPLSSLSYSVLSPTFDSYLLPKISISSESDKETVVDGPLSLLSIDSDVEGNITDKSSKDLRNEIDKRSTTPTSSVYEPEAVNNKLRDLIEKQKQEYLIAMETLKNKFTNEQHDLLSNFQSNLLVSSTPLENSIVASTDDEEFTAFKTCLQSQSQSRSLEEKTIINDEYAKLKASIIINAAARGHLTRKLMKTIYVQEHIRNIRETLQLVLNLNEKHVMDGSPVQNILQKARLFKQLQNDLYNFNEIFLKYSIKEKMKIISTDRDLRMKRVAEENKENLSLSFNEVV